MVHSLHGWVNHILTFLKVGYPPHTHMHTHTPSRKKRKKKRVTTTINLNENQWGSWENLFKGPHGGRRSSSENRARLTHGVCLLMVKMKRPSCSQRELFEATCCLMCSCWSFFFSFLKNRTKNIYFDLGFEDSESDWRFRHVLLLFLRHSLVFFLIWRKFIFHTPRITELDQTKVTLHKFWRIFALYSTYW